jgi:hypothetical protein
MNTRRKYTPATRAFSLVRAHVVISAPLQVSFYHRPIVLAEQLLHLGEVPAFGYPPAYLGLVFAALAVPPPACADMWRSLIGLGRITAGASIELLRSMVGSKLGPTVAVVHISLPFCRSAHISLSLHSLPIMSPSRSSLLPLVTLSLAGQGAAWGALGHSEQSSNDIEVWTIIPDYGPT